MEDRPSSYRIGRDLEDQVEVLLRSWSIPYRRGYRIVTSFGSRFATDFWLPAREGQPPVVIEAKNFGVAALRTADSRARKAQEALYLLVHLRRHCDQTRNARIVVISGAEKFTTEQVKFLTAELGLDFHVVPINEPERLRTLLLPNQSARAEEPAPATLRDA
jgi:hypothetical protein